MIAKRHKLFMKSHDYCDCDQMRSLFHSYIATYEAIWTGNVCSCTTVTILHSFRHIAELKNFHPMRNLAQSMALSGTGARIRLQELISMVKIAAQETRGRI